jgi:hypothetical protein
MEALSPTVERLSSARNIAGGEPWPDGLAASGYRFGCQGRRRAKGSDLPPRNSAAILQLHGCAPLRFLHSKLTITSPLALPFAAKPLENARNI